MKNSLASVLLCSLVSSNAFAQSPTAVASAPIPGTSINIALESAHIIGSGVDLNIYRVPVTVGDATMLFDIRTSLSFSTGSLAFGPLQFTRVEPPFPATKLMPGAYLDQQNCEYSFEGPSQFADGRELYTLRGSDGNPFSAQIVTGPAVGHPDIGVRDIAPELTETYQYGIVLNQGQPNCSLDHSWLTTRIIGLRQAGSSLTVSLFTDSSGDHPAPVDGATLTPVAP